MTDNNKHLVRVGHEFAAAMSDDTPIITIAKMVTELASALDVQSARSEALAVENANIKNFRSVLEEIKSSLVGGGHGHMAAIDMQAQNAVLDVVFDAFDDIKTPATDAWVKEQRAAGRVEGVNFAAARLAAAFNHGFIDKPTAEVYDVVKAVLGAKEELATAPDDGLSGEYAEQALNDWAAQLRGGQV